MYMSRKVKTYIIRKKTGYMDMDMKKYRFKMYGYDKSNGHKFWKINRCDKINGLSFEKFIATIKSTDKDMKKSSLW
jgi:hypothetical protein